MRFVIGVAIGFGVGFAGAVLLAPDRRRSEQSALPNRTVESGPLAFDTDHSIIATMRSALRSVQERVNEALEEAKKAQAETEREMRARYDRIASRAREEGAAVAEEKSKAKGKRGK
jgi:gas vesicle protein